MTLTTDRQARAIATSAAWPITHHGPADGRQSPRPSRGKPSALSTPQLEVSLLGGFRIERADASRLECHWIRRSAKTLTKLLATRPGHTLHREHIIDILWPGVDIDSALNSFGKALHVARHALEPDLPPRGGSQYLLLADGMLTLNMQHVAVDADRFERLAGDAFRRREVEVYETALAAYGGELLPEDRYADWCTERRESLAEMHLRLLLGLADALEGKGAHAEAAASLRQIVSEDPTREEVHRRLMRLLAEMGSADEAVRQFHLCEAALARDLNLMPQQETLTLYEDLLANCASKRGEHDVYEAAIRHRTAAGATGPAAPFVGREQVLKQLMRRLERIDGCPPMLLLTGEAGIGKTRLLDAFAAAASPIGTVLRGDVGGHISHLPYGPVAVALEGFVSARPMAERRDLVRRYPALARLIPSLGPEAAPARPMHVGGGEPELLIALVRALSELARARPVLFIVDDLHEADSLGLGVLRYFAHLGRQRRWLFAGAIREEVLQGKSPVAATLESMLRGGLCARLELGCLSRADGHALIREFAGRDPIRNDVARDIYFHSGGNPLFIEALVADVREHGELSTSAGCAPLLTQPDARVPPPIRGLVRSQLKPLDDTVRRFLALVAAAGTPETSLDRLLAAAAALEPPIAPASLFNALDEALSLRILEERPGGYGFRYPIVRWALCQELPRHRRAELRAALGHRGGERPARLQVSAACR